MPVGIDVNPRDTYWFLRCFTLDHFRVSLGRFSFFWQRSVNDIEVDFLLVKRFQPLADNVFVKQNGMFKQQRFLMLLNLIKSEW